MIEFARTAPETHTKSIIDKTLKKRIFSTMIQDSAIKKAAESMIFCAKTGLEKGRKRLERVGMGFVEQNTEQNGIRISFI